MRKKTNWIVYVLLGFGIVISGPRFSGAFAAAIGFDLFSTSPIWAFIETFSGWALAIFEAMAFAYIASRFRRIQILDENTSLPLRKRILPANFIYWLMLLAGQAILLLSIPAISMVHQATQVFRLPNGKPSPVPDILTWNNLLQNHLTWIWLFTTSAASTLFVFLIGLVMDDFGVLAGKKDTDDMVLFEHFTKLKQTGSIVDPYKLAGSTGVSVTRAAEFLDSLVIPAQTRQLERLERLKSKVNNNDGAL